MSRDAIGDQRVMVDKLRTPSDHGEAFLVGEKLYLRPLRDSDLTEDYLSWLNDPEVTRYLDTGKFPATIQDLHEYLERFRHSRSDLVFAIVDRQTDLHIGNVTLSHINWIHRTADTGLMIGRKEFWGKGYAWEAWRLLLEYAFDRLGLRKIVAGAVDENTPSLRVLQKLGFQIEGVCRQEFFVNGKFCDRIRLGLLKEEFVRS